MEDKKTNRTTKRKVEQIEEKIFDWKNYKFIFLINFLRSLVITFRIQRPNLTPLVK